jgi:hypothetical protein
LGASELGREKKPESYTDKKENFPHIQGADDKLGQFLNQDI